MAKCNMDCFNCKYEDCINDSHKRYPSWDYQNRSEEYKKRQLQRNKEYKARHKALGLCVQCSRKAVVGKVLCAECALRRKRYYRERREKEKLSKEENGNGA